MIITFLNILVAATSSIEEWITCLIYQVIHNNLVNIPLKYAYWILMQMIIIDKQDSVYQNIFSSVWYSYFGAPQEAAGRVSSL